MVNGQDSPPRLPSVGAVVKICIILKGLVLDGAFLSIQIQGVVDRELGNCERAIKQGNSRRALAELAEATRKLASLAVHIGALEK